MQVGPHTHQSAIKLPMAGREQLTASALWSHRPPADRDLYFHPSETPNPEYPIPARIPCHLHAKLTADYSRSSMGTRRFRKYTPLATARRNHS